MLVGFLIPSCDQCWTGIDKKHARGYGYDVCSGILARVEFNTRAMPVEAHGCMHACQNPYPLVFSVSNTRGGAQAHHGYLLSAIPVRNPAGIAYRKYP